MNRLTNKNVVLCKARSAGKTIWNDIYYKLFALEDLESELGCPLDVVFKALKYGIDGYLQLILEYDENEGWYFDAIWKYNDFGDYSNILYLKDYKKSWWLKSEVQDNE